MKVSISGLGKRLRQVRISAGLSTSALAQLLGVHRNSLVGYEAESSEPGVSICLGLRSAGLDWTYVVSGLTAPQFAVDHVDWQLLEEIRLAIDTRLAQRGQTLNSEKRSAVLKAVYKQSIDRKSAGNTQMIDDFLSLAA